MTNNRKKILVVAAHPDDEVLGCGASIAKHVAKNDKVRVLLLGEGVTSRRKLSETQKEKLIVQLRKMTQKAARILGVEKITTKSFPDNKFDSVPLLDIIHAIEQEMEVFNPDIVYTHNKSDVNIDHRKTLEAVESAVRPIPSRKTQTVLAFEIPSSTEWNFIRYPFAPNYFNGIKNEFLAKKIRALISYSSEKRPFPHPRSPEFSEALAKVRGSQSGQNLAEAFEVIYEINS